MASRAKRRFEQDFVLPLEGQMVFSFVDDDVEMGFANGYDGSKEPDKECTGEADCVCDKCRLKICL